MEWWSVVKDQIPSTKYLRFQVSGLRNDRPEHCNLNTETSLEVKPFKFDFTLRIRFVGLNE
jgi:hypothetical protein